MDNGLVPVTDKVMFLPLKLCNFVTKIWNGHKVDLYVLLKEYADGRYLAP